MFRQLEIDRIDHLTTGARKRGPLTGMITISAGTRSCTVAPAPPMYTKTGCR